MKASIKYKEYRDDDAISPSDVKVFGRDIAAFYKYKILKQPIEERVSSALIIGDIADMILTQPNDIDKLYYILTDWKATEKVKDIVDLVYKKRTEFIQKSKNDATSLGPNHPTTQIPEDDMEYLTLDDNDLADILMDAITEIGYYSNTWTMQKRIQTIIDKGSAYYEQLQETRGRTIVDMKTYTKALQSVERARQDEKMQPYIRAIEGTEVPPNVIIKKQVAVYGIWEGIRIKGLLDTLWADMEKRTVQLIEIKTAKYLQMFLKSAKLRRYDIQIDLYSYILEQILASPASPYYGFTLLPPVFMVLPIEGEQHPEWFKFTDKDYRIARYGYDSGPGKHVYGWTESLRDIEWHIQNSKWDHHKDYYATDSNIIDLWGSNIELLEIEDEDIFNDNNNK
jgi:hypothetical protein